MGYKSYTHPHVQISHAKLICDKWTMNNSSCMTHLGATSLYSKRHWATCANHSTIPNPYLCYHVATMAVVCAQWHLWVNNYRDWLGGHGWNQLELLEFWITSGDFPLFLSISVILVLHVSELDEDKLTIHTILTCGR